jgi:hypothetical protein
VIDVTASNLNLVESRIEELSICRSSQSLLEKSLYVQGLINGLKLAENLISPQITELYERLNGALDNKIAEVTKRLISCH